MGRTASGARVGSGYAPLPREEHVCDCTVDGKDVRCFGGDVRERVVRCKDCRMFDGVGCDLLDFAMPHMENGFCAWAIENGEG